MNAKYLLCTAVICAAITFTACTNVQGPIPASAESEESAAAVSPAAEESLYPGLYPAYIVEGSRRKWGYINRSGEFVIRPQYDNAAAFKSNGMAEVSDSAAWKLIDSTGKPVLESRYLYTYDFSDGLLVVTTSGKSYLYNKNGQVLFETEGAIDRQMGDRAAFSRRIDEGKYLWGYINAEGKVVVEPKYETAQGFSQDRAIVMLSEGRFGIIDKEGRLLKEVEARTAGSLSEDVFVFSRTDSEGRERYGYMTLDGEVLLEPVYSQAYGFADGMAIVNAAKDYEYKYGVINKKGEFVIPAAYAQITYLGDGMFAVPEAHETYYITEFVRKALFDNTGKQLTGFEFYNAESLENGLISVADEKSTYLVDKTGKAVDVFPRIPGVGSIRLMGDIYRVEADNELAYYSKDGKKLWSSDNTYRFEDGLQVATRSFRPDRCKLIQYPELEGMKDQKAQESINAMLKESFVGDGKGSDLEGGLYTESIEVGFSAEKNKDMLIISENGYYYPIGAAHGQPTREEYHINVRTGKLYTLKDLFKTDSNYIARLTGLVREKIARTNAELGENIYGDEIGNLETDGGFVFGRDSLRIYFYPYAIASYAAGFPEFDISYRELEDIIDTDGELWNSFDREQSSINGDPGYELSAEERAMIEEVVKGYETTLIEAINSNDFSLVEPWLYTGSSLYESQKKLISDLNKKQIRERLEGYETADITRDSLGVIRVYVTENIAIQYPGKDYEVKQFKWVYSVSYSYEKDGYRLTYIDKWE